MKRDLHDENFLKKFVLLRLCLNVIQQSICARLHWCPFQVEIVQTVLMRIKSQFCPFESPPHLLTSHAMRVQYIKFCFMFYSYYYKRWDLFVNSLVDSLKTHTEFDQDAFNKKCLETVEIPWTEQQNLYPTKPTGKFTNQNTPTWPFRT